MKNYKIISLVFTIFVMNCGSLIQSNAPMHGLQGVDLDAKLFMQVSRSENFSPTIGAKRGESCQRQVIGLFAWGDTSLPTVRKIGSITTIDHVSFERTVVLNTFPFLPLPPLYSSVCVIAFGN